MVSMAAYQCSCAGFRNLHPMALAFRSLRHLSKSFQNRPFAILVIMSSGTDKRAGMELPSLPVIVTLWKWDGCCRVILKIVKAGI